jgi:hypothetical protein
MLQEKREMQKRDNLKKKILEEASKNRENKLREITDIENMSEEPKLKSTPHVTNF